MGTPPIEKVKPQGATATPNPPQPLPEVEGAEKRQAMSPEWIRFFAYYYSLLALLLVVILVKVWPSSIPATQGESHVVALLGGWIRIPISQELQMILVVVLSGALGSYVHGATSFVTFAGTRSIVASWRWWYILRPFIGSVLALGFYFVVRAGFFDTAQGTQTTTLLGFAAMAFLVGMFTRQATEKLSQLFDALFGVPPEYKPQTDKLATESEKEKQGQTPKP